MVVAVAINFGGTKMYGEAEFWFAIIKVLTIVGLIILSIILDAGGGPQGDAIGFRYWRNPGPMVQYLVSLRPHSFSSSCRGLFVRC